MTLRKLFTISVAACAICMSGAPRAPKGNVLDVKESITDSNIVFPESFETDTQKLLESWYMKNYTATDDKYMSSDVKTTDDQIRQRLSQLPTVIEMPFNSIVRTYIDRYTQRGRAQVAATLGLANYYMPIFEQALEEAGLPLELKYLPVVESALNPNAVSKHGATGLWQFMLATGKGLGMEVNSLVDERRDPYVSSRKAARYLKDLHSTYGDWSLAIAAYNCGPGAVNKAVRRAGDGKHDFWSIYEYLSPETRGYVPAFIAANYVMNYYPEHGISPVIPTKPLVTDTVGVAGRVHFNQISEVLDIPVEELRLLNPQFRADLIPGSPEKPYMLILPSQQVHAYIVSEDQIKGHEAERYARRDVVEPGDMPSESSVEMEMADPSAADVRQTLAADNLPAEEPAMPARQTPAAGRPATHKVAAGETLASIAALYGVTPAEVKRWNNLRRNSVRVGQQLRVAVDAQAETSVSADSSVPASRQQVSPAKAKRQSKSASSSKKGKKGRKEAKPTQHSIKNGENLTVIAKKYGVSVDEIKRANNMKDDDIRAGKSIKIPSKGTSKKKTASKRKNKKRRR